LSGDELGESLLVNRLGGGAVGWEYLEADGQCATGKGERREREGSVVAVGRRG